jgi:hypothetical protein
MFGRFWKRLQTSPKVDPGHVGVSFVEVLFALVVGYMLTPLATWWKIPWSGWGGLGVAAVLTLTSWIGYHNSSSNPKWVISFPNLPLLVFILDICMVVAYAFSVFVATSITSGASQTPQMLPEAVIVAVSFLLYCLWDWVNLAIMRAEPYKTAWNQAIRDGILKTSDVFPPDYRGRRMVTIGCFFIAAVAATVAFEYDNHVARLSQMSVVTFDLLLVALLIVFRLAKEFVTPSRPPADGPKENPACVVVDAIGA